MFSFEGGRIQFQEENRPEPLERCTAACQDAQFRALGVDLDEVESIDGCALAEAIQTGYGNPMAGTQVGRSRMAGHVDDRSGALLIRQAHLMCDHSACSVQREILSQPLENDAIRLEGMNGAVLSQPRRNG